MDHHLTVTARKMEADRGASPVLVAVVREFRNKLAKAEGHRVDGVPARDAVIAMEQPVDSAKAAAEADTRLAPEVRESVLAAHLAICKLNAGT